MVLWWWHGLAVTCWSQST